MTFASMNILSEAAQHPELGGGALRVLVILVKHADFRDGTCYPSQNSIGRALGVSQQAVAENIKKLTKFGFLETTSQKNASGANTVNLYRIKSPAPTSPACNPPQGEPVTPTSPEVVAPPQAQLVAINVSNSEPKKDNKPKPAKKRKPRTAPDRYPVEFDALWKIFPHGSNPDKPWALDKWEEAIASGASAEEIHRAAEIHRQTVLAEGTVEKYRKRLHTWLMSRCFEQVLEMADAPDERSLWERGIALAQANRDEAMIERIMVPVRAKNYAEADAIAAEYLSPKHGKQNQAKREAFA